MMTFQDPQPEFVQNAAAAVTSAVAPQPDAAFEPFDPRNIFRERTSNVIFTAVVGVGLIVGAVFLYFGIGFGLPFQVSLVGAGLLYASLAWFTFFWPAIEHRHRSWRLSEVGLEYHYGVWWKHRHAVPWARVQHADVSQGPLERLYGVGTLSVHTAGTSNSSVNLAGLSHERAIEVRDEIIRQRTTDDVV